MDPVFEHEQAHLSETYGKLQAIERELVAKLNDLMSNAANDIATMRDELSIDLSDASQALETHVEFEILNTLIDAYNLSSDVNAERLSRASLLLKQPYFAKVTLQFKPSDPPKEIYIGAAGMTDDSRRHFIVDWRSPVAEVYYNQENGPTSYQANGRTIHVDLKQRRQFDIERDTLRAYFDTTVAIEDPLLLASLSKHRSDRLQAITTTIQKEQNQVIRHEDVPVLLVNGIAGSGKTSVLLQRIAYLFYRFRDTLSPENVCLITPNPVFQRYIDNVLPDMGESNPKTLTFSELMARVGVGDRGTGKDVSPRDLAAIDEAVKTLSFLPQDFCDIAAGRQRAIAASQVQSVVASFKNIEAGPRLVALVSEELRDRLESKVGGLAASEQTHADMMDLPLEEMRRIFGYQIFPQSEEEFVELARIYLDDLFAPAFAAIDDARWLRIDHIGMRLLGKQSLSATEWLYLKLAICGEGDRDVRFVMIDEVQDYSAAQLMMIGRYFPHAHFLLLGDENQAVKPGTASFDEIRDLFSRTHGTVDECRLATSYRSTPEITELFASLLDEHARIDISSVQRPGTKPVIRACEHDDYEAALAETVRDASDAIAATGGLAAVIAPSKKQARRAAALLGESCTLVTDDGALPDHGVVVMHLELAKGLEFDRVIIVDANPLFYPDDPLARRRLYTAISRATQHVTILSSGALSPLLEGANAGAPTL